MPEDTRKNGYVSLMKTIYPSCRFEFVANADGYTLKDLFADSELQVFNVPDFITELSVGCCSGISSIKTVRLGANIKRVGEGCFANCKNLTTIYVPNELRKFEKALLMYTRAKITYCDIGVTDVTDILPKVR